MEIKLTEVEDRVCTLLDDCTKWMKNEHNLDTSCRIAGGWVRDKVNINSSWVAGISEMRDTLSPSCIL